MLCSGIFARKRKKKSVQGNLKSRTGQESPIKRETRSLKASFFYRMILNGVCDPEDGEGSTEQVTPVYNTFSFFENDKRALVGDYAPQTRRH